ncbi:hypothetical protein GOBAR_AA31216 [Gossypium barbadense]|uniref:Uncharacterized protein n=1 Tax=Gossypium barbadense TaxID=3634 RepID=A0A2P5WEG8_GOSBA|nr:hypothetical protein GOBAR_AA31216 [Gossypium barbadense]
MLEKREKEIFILTKKLEDHNSESLFGVKNLTAQENNLLSEKETLQAEKALLKENFAFEGDEASNQVQRLIDEANTLQQQLESLHIQKAKLELQFERKKQKSSEKLNEMENQKSELKQMVEDLQRNLEAKGDEKNDLLAFGAVETIALNLDPNKERGNKLPKSSKAKEKLKVVEDSSELKSL